VETDYLIIGAGAMGLAFADSLHKEQPNSKIIIVDKRSQAGGHWVDDYRFVTLHQPAAFYGVGGLRLGNGNEDLSSHAELVNYFDAVKKKLQETGKVKFFFMSEYVKEGLIKSVYRPNDALNVKVQNKVVNAAYMKVTTPSTHTPNFKIDEDINLSPINYLSDLKHGFAKYCIIGGGKTAIDAIIFLIKMGVAYKNIKWIIPNDMWLWRRDVVQVGLVADEFVKFLTVIKNSSETNEIFLKLEKEGSLLRLDRTILPQKWRCATVSIEEFSLLKQVTDIVRMGRLEHITSNSIKLQKGEINSEPDTLFVDCTANGLASRQTMPIFSPSTINLQSVLMCQQTFSAALLAKIESLNITEEEKNRILAPVPHPERAEDMPDILVKSMENILMAIKNAPIWMRKNRLSIGAHISLVNLCYNILRISVLIPKAKQALLAIDASKK